MGISVVLLRVPLEPAVDMLSQRTSFNDFAEYLETELMPYDPEEERRDAPDPESLGLDLMKAYRLTLDVLTETAHEHHSSLFLTEEFADPLAWAAFGARLPKWEEDPLLRYSLGSDLDAICDALGTIDETEIERRIRRLLKVAPGYGRGIGPWAQSRVRKVLPAMPEFYRRARSAGEVVIHRMY
ncbi:MAG: hypothetical protein AAGI91_10830 [Bacteroidota bacterium]